MSIARSFLIGSGLPALALAIASPSMAETRGYAISFVHMATYAEQGNCPNGGNGATTEIHLKVLMDAGKTREQALKTIVGHDRKIDFDHRGHLYGQEVTIGDFPTSVPDDHIETVQGAGPGHHAYGFDLAGKETPYSFEDPDTHERVQNQLWRAYGCFSTYEYKDLRIPPYSEGITWDTAMDSMPAWLLSISGPDLEQGRRCHSDLRSLAPHPDARSEREGARRILIQRRSRPTQPQRIQGAHQGPRADD